MTHSWTSTWIVAALLALTLVTFGGSSAASQAAPAAQPAPPDSPDAHLGRAYDALREDRYEVAAAEFRAALKLDAHELNAQDSATADLLYLETLAVARKAQSARQYPEALRYFHEAARLKSQEPAPHRGLADVYKLTGRPAQAAAEQQEADRLASIFDKTQ